jgi:hypothetical protein
MLRGERIHQWLGARYRVYRSPVERLKARLTAQARHWLRPGRPLRGIVSDLDRIERQQVLLRELMRQGFDFSRALGNPEWVSATGPGAVEEVARAGPSWTFQTLADVKPRTIGAKQVLVHR